MDIKSFQKSSSGHIIKTTQGYYAFVPSPLPPKISYTEPLVQVLTEAERHLATLAGVGRLLPNPYLLASSLMRREAVLSSRIEGTLSSVSDLFVFEAAPHEKPRQGDVKEVSNYVNALNHGLKRLKRLPISLRLVRELHRELVQGVRGDHGRPGEFRKKQNWIGSPECTLEEATYVPPPPSEMERALDAWEKFVNDPDKRVPVMLRCAMLHYQFEAIHPFVDGNGRVGRLLVILFLQEKGLLPQPLLYLSAFFEKNKNEYYDRLQGVSESGNWESWFMFFLRGIATQSLDAVVTTESILNLYQKYRGVLKQAKATTVTFELLDNLFVNPYTMVRRVGKKLRVSYPTASGAVSKLVDIGILREITGRKRNRIFCAEDLLEVIAGEAKEN